MSVWLRIITDNTLHVIWNGLALKFLGAWTIRLKGSPKAAQRTVAMLTEGLQNICRDSSAPVYVSPKTEV